MNSLSLNNSYKTRQTGLLLGLLVFIRTMPCYLWAFESILRPLCAIAILIICLTNVSKEKWTGWIFFSIASAYVWATTFVDHSGLITTFNFLAFACIPILKQEVVFEAYNAFRKIFIVMLVLSIANYILVLIGFDSLGIVIEPLNKLKDYKYLMHLFLVEPIGIGSNRFLAVYDEPGYIGTIVGLMLIAERMNIQRKGNIVLLIGGLLSMSLYFYVSMIFGFILFSSKLKQKWIYLGLLFVFVIATYKNEYMYNTIWSRLEYDVDAGKFSGDNRNTKVVDNVFESMLGTPLFFTGLGAAAVKDFMGSASIKLIILKHGFIFVLLNLIGYLLLSFRQIAVRKDLLFFFLFFILTLYQRPGFYNTASIFLYVMVINRFGYKGTGSDVVKEKS